VFEWTRMECILAAVHDSTDPDPLRWKETGKWKRGTKFWVQ
jgi:hypothetical protein